VVPVPQRQRHESMVMLEGLAEDDTVVVPAHEDGFRDVFLRENRWYPVRIRQDIRSRLKYLAVYQTAPVSAITHIARIASIDPWKDTDKVEVIFAGPAREIGPIPLVKGGRVRPGALQNLRYTTKRRLDSAANLDDIW